ncbi:hypothetical protein O0L34_g16308 [Tuta absoluta]|nr:hypothetical protein O0L34_g16308 [Tuta absoluta]
MKLLAALLVICAANCNGLYLSPMNHHHGQDEPLVIVIQDSSPEEDSFYDETRGVHLNHLRATDDDKTPAVIPDVIHNLYYSEVDADGKVVFTKWLYNLKDVVVLFRDRFKVDIM